MFSLHVYYKQGDDFNSFLSDEKNVSDALKEWAACLKEKAAQLEKLSSMLEGKAINAYADTHMISFEGDNPILKEAAEQGLLYEDEYEEYEEEYEEEECDEDETGK